MNEETRKFLIDTYESLVVTDDQLNPQVVSLNAILDMVLTKNYPDDDCRYCNIDIGIALRLKHKIASLQKTNPHNYVPFVRWFIVDLLNGK